jgi:hypothetical protein
MQFAKQHTRLHATPGPSDRDNKDENSGGNIIM